MSEEVDRKLLSVPPNSLPLQGEASAGQFLWKLLHQLNAVQALHQMIDEATWLRAEMSRMLAEGSLV